MAQLTGVIHRKKKEKYRMLKMNKLKAHIPDVEAHIQKELAIALRECKEVDVCDKLIADLKLSKQVNAMP